MFTYKLYKAILDEWLYPPFSHNTYGFDEDNDTNAIDYTTFTKKLRKGLDLVQFRARKSIPKKKFCVLIPNLIFFYFERLVNAISA